MTKAEKNRMIRAMREAQFYHKVKELKQRIGEFHLRPAPSKSRCRICGTNDMYTPKYVCFVSAPRGQTSTNICYTHFKEEECYGKETIANKKIQNILEESLR